MAGSIFQHRDNRHATLLSTLGDLGRGVAKGTRRVQMAQKRAAVARKRPAGKARPRAVVRGRPQNRRVVQKNKKKPQRQRAIRFV